MDAKEMIDYIVSNDKTEEVLEALGCIKIKTYGKSYRCGSEKYHNPTSIEVVKDTLKVKVRSDESYYGNIYNLVMDLKDCDFHKSLLFLHKVCGVQYSYTIGKKEEKDKVDILDVFKKVKRKKKFVRENLTIYKEDVFDEFEMMPYYEWVKEGILPSTQEVFRVGYSRKSNRVVFPHTYWSGSKNDIVGIIGRTLNKNYELLDIPKYFPLISYSKSMNLYGLNENYADIQKAGVVNVFEAEKSVMKRHSRLDKTGVALCCHDISEEQVRILIGLNVDIVIQLDSDVPIEKTWEICDNFYGIRNAYYVYDNAQLFLKAENKESPADKPCKVYDYLYSHKIKYDEEEHNKYIEYKKKCFTNYKK